jgi:hypothetical protein
MESRSGQNELRERAVFCLSRTAIAASLFLAAACTDATGPADRVRIVPETPTVTLQTTPQGRVLSTSVTLTNNSSYRVAWSSCGVSLEKAGMPALPPGKSDWQTVWRRICYLLDAAASQSGATSFTIPFDAQILQPGQSVTIPVSAVVAQPPYPEFTGEIGQYRVRIPLSIQLLLGAYVEITPERSVSDPFTLLSSS